MKWYCIEKTLKCSPKKLPELSQKKKKKKISEQRKDSVKISRNKINIKKFVAFFSTKDEISERKTKKTTQLKLNQSIKLPSNKFNQGAERPIL